MTSFQLLRVETDSSVPPSAPPPAHAHRVGQPAASRWKSIALEASTHTRKKAQDTKQ